MHWRQVPYSEIEALDRHTTVLILPIGAIEAHGPHLPTGTDGVISEGMAEAAVRQLRPHGLTGLVLPTLDFTVAQFARNFVGTLSFSAATVLALLADLGQILTGQGWQKLAVANSHLDPAHLACLRQAFANYPLQVAFPDLTRGRLARQLTPEFQSGACHAGQFEGSMVLARQPQWTRPAVAAALPDNPHSLVDAIREGKSHFGEAGGPHAYFGSPRQASACEGEVSLETLGRLLVESVLQLA
ncbi:creatininase family protein [bacterium]|nr:creatininase family protein [bacterium]